MKLLLEGVKDTQWEFIIVLGLWWSNIDEAQGCFHIMQQLASREAKKATGETLAELKEDHSLRTLPITYEASIYFEWQKARRNASVSSDFIVCREEGKPLSEGHISRDFNKLIKELGLPYCRFHDLRHPYVKYTPKNNLGFFRICMFGML